VGGKQLALSSLLADKKKVHALLRYVDETGRARGFFFFYFSFYPYLFTTNRGHQTAYCLKWARMAC